LTLARDANVNVLETLGADKVLLTTDEEFKVKLKKYALEFKATVLLDSVADEDTPKCLSCMPNSSTAIIYGRLTETHDPIGGLFSVSDMIFRDINIEGFWLATYIRKVGALRTILLKNYLQKVSSIRIFMVALDLMIFRKLSSITLRIKVMAKLFFNRMDSFFLDEVKS